MDSNQIQKKGATAYPRWNQAELKRKTLQMPEDNFHRDPLIREIFIFHESRSNC
jgi:hypothetical protein